MALQHYNSQHALTARGCYSMLGGAISQELVDLTYKDFCPSIKIVIATDNFLAIERRIDYSSNDGDPGSLVVSAVCVKASLPSPGYLHS